MIYLSLQRKWAGLSIGQEVEGKCDKSHLKGTQKLVHTPVVSLTF